MRKLIALTMLLCAAPLVMAQSETVKVDPVIKTVEAAWGRFERLPTASQVNVVKFLDKLQANIKESGLRALSLPQGVEDTAAIDALLPFVTGVRQDYEELASRDDQAAQFVGYLLYTSKFHLKNKQKLSIPQFIVQYRSYIQTRTDLDSFYNDIFSDAEALKKAE